MPRTSLPPAISASDSAPVTHASLVRRMREYAALSRERYPITRPDGARDERHLTPSQEKKLVSYLSRALTASGIGIASDECVRVLVPDLSAMPTTRAIHADAPSAVAAALKVAFGYQATRRAQLPGKTARRLLPSAYRRLLTCVEPTDSFAAQAANLLTMVARAARASGATDAPRVMPSSTAMTLAADQLSGLSGPRLKRAVSVYRRLRARAVSADPLAPFGPVPDGRVERPGGRGLLHTMAHLARVGHPQSADFLEAAAAGDQRAALAIAFPGLAEDLDTYLRSPRAERKKAHEGLHLARTQRDVIDGVCNCAASLLTIGCDDHSVVDAEWCWTALRHGTAASSATNLKMRRRAERKAQSTGEARAVDIPMSRCIADQLASQSREVSPTESTTAYPAAVTHDLWALWAVTVAVYEEDLTSSEPDLWVQMKSAWLALRERFKKRLAYIPDFARKQKKRGVAAFPLPYLLAFGLPMLAADSRRALTRARQLIKRAGALNPSDKWDTDRDARAAVDIFADVALRYLVTALVLWDSMRASNYHFGLYGVHMRVITLHDGTRVVQTAWTDDPSDRARCKQGKERTWNLPIGSIALDILDGYLELVRAPRLMRRGVSAMDAMAANGAWCLFVTDERTSDPQAPLSATQMARECFGGGLLWIANNVFGTRGLPLDPDAIDRAHWRGVFAPHFTRDLKATWLGTVLGEWAAAEEHTMDEQRTLRTSYAQSLYGGCFDAAGWDVAAWEPWVRRAMLGSGRAALDAFTDARLSALLPAAATQTLLQWKHADRAEAVRARGTVGKVSGARTRRKRPGQPPPRCAEAATVPPT